MGLFTQNLNAFQDNVSYRPHEHGPLLEALLPSRDLVMQPGLCWPLWYYVLPYPVRLEVISASMRTHRHALRESESYSTVMVRVAASEPGSVPVCTIMISFIPARIDVH